jgi:DNA-binding transcriptional LysR family regulator
MEMFVRVVETGSFSAAARDFKIGQPAISKMIAGLEDRLSARLLVRSTRRLSPTEAGMAFYERALRTLTEADEAEAVARGAGAGRDGRLRICAPVTFARMHLVPTLGAFLDTHPKLKLELVMEDRTIDLVAENIDVALCWGALIDSTLVRWMFAPELGSGEVESVLDEWTLPPIDLWVIFLSGRLTSAKARTFVKWFESMMSGSPLIRPAATDSPIHSR